jgi:hypothetical protein
MTTWHKGPPPSIDWWPASIYRSDESLRWWDGERWSAPAYPNDSVHQASAYAKSPSTSQYEIEWTDRPAWWPERSKT